MTGLWVPECSCHGCLERMLRELAPELLAGEIRISRAAGPAAPGDEPGTAEHSSAA